MSRDYKVVCLSECFAPITHMARSEGNYQIIAREPVVTPRGVTHVPYLSGNAIRHRMVREPGFRWLSAEYGLHGKLTLQQLNFLFHGGNLTEGGAPENTRRIADFQRLFPLGRLLGGCLPDQVLAGSLQCWRGTLVCEENRPALAHMVGDHLPELRLRPAESFVSNYQYTRGDAAKNGLDLAPADLDGEIDSNLMIFSGQNVLSARSFVHGFSLPHVDVTELVRCSGHSSSGLPRGPRSGDKFHGAMAGSVSRSLAATSMCRPQSAVTSSTPARSETRRSRGSRTSSSRGPRPQRHRHVESSAAGHGAAGAPLAGDVPRLDALLEAALAVFHEKGIPGYKIDRSGPCPPQGEIPIPLLRRRLGPWMVGACSDPIYPDCAAQYVEHFTKKLGVENWPPLLGEENRLVVSASNSWTKSYRLPLRIRRIDRVSWFAVADRKSLLKALNHIEFLGKKRSYGYGQVVKWDAAEVSRDYSWYASMSGGTVLMATLPAGDWLPAGLLGARRAFGGCVPPYWHPDRYAEIVTPC